MANERDRSTLSGLTAAEAQEFHKFMVQGTLGFVAVSAVAHLLIWFWRPWF
jgi:light-harvesting complex 1 beta chain